MKIFISADMEGISGVATNMQLKKNDEYQRFRRLMTQDVNAAIEGLLMGELRKLSLLMDMGICPIYSLKNLIIERV